MASISFYSTRLKRLIVFANTNSVIAQHIQEKQAFFTTGKREFRPAIVLLRKLSTSREVEIIY